MTGGPPVGAELRIRPFDDRDAAATVAIIEQDQGRADSSAPQRLTAMEQTLVVSGILARKGISLVAEVAGDVVGHVVCARDEDARRSHCGAVAIIVDNSWRGRGVGKALLGRLIAEARQAGLRRLALEVLPDNQSAIRLYESVGFVQEGVLRGAVEMAHGDGDIVVMGLLLRDDA